MTLEELLAQHGFSFSASCGGKGSYTKWVKHQGKRAYISVTDKGGDSFPTSLEEPVRVAVHDLKTGEEVEPPREFASLKAFLDSLKEDD